MNHTRSGNASQFKSKNKTTTGSHNSSADAEVAEESLYSIEGEENNDIDLILETRISNSLFS